MYRKTNLNVTAGTLVLNHKSDFVALFRPLMRNWRKEDMKKWKQMKALEVAAAVVAEALADNGVEFNENDTIQWPMGPVTTPPKRTKKSKGPVLKATTSVGQLFKEIENSLIQSEKERALMNIGIFVFTESVTRKT